MRSLSPAVERTLAVVVLGAAFLVMASVFVPSTSNATYMPAPEVVPPPVSVDATPDFGPSTDPLEGLAHLGTLLDARYTISIYAGAVEPLYCVDNLDGERLATLRTADQITREFPEIPISWLLADTPTLQLADIPYDDIH